MIYQLEEIEINPYYTNFLTMRLRGFIDITALKNASEEYDETYIHNRYTIDIHPNRFKNKLLSIGSECVLRATGERKIVVPVFTTTEYVKNFYFEEEAAILSAQVHQLPKHQQKEFWATNSEKLNKEKPFGIFYLGNDDHSYGFRLENEQEVEDYLALEEATGELDTILWRN